MKELTEIEKRYLSHAFAFMIKSPEKIMRDRANTLKSRYKTELAILRKCYPYQTADGCFLTKSLDKANGEKVYKEKKITYASALTMLEESIKNYFDCYFRGKESMVEIHEIGEIV